jgi:hypothetical protein
MFCPEDSIDEVRGSSREKRIAFGEGQNDERGLPLRRPPQALNIVQETTNSRQEQEPCSRINLRGCRGLTLSRGYFFYRALSSALLRFFDGKRSNIWLASLTVPISHFDPRFWVAGFFFFSSTYLFFSGSKMRGIKWEMGRSISLVF